MDTIVARVQLKDLRQQGCGNVVVNHLSMLENKEVVNRENNIYA